MKHKNKQLRNALEDFAIATRTEFMHREGINKTGCLDKAMINIKNIFKLKKRKIRMDKYLVLATKTGEHR